MIKYYLYGALLLITFASCNTYHRQVASLSPNCQKLLRELKYRIITNDTGSYTFRFEHPISDTIPKSGTPRDLEFQNFYKKVLGNDSLCKCGFTYDLIVRTIGEEDKKDYGPLTNKKLVTATYILDFGFNCGGNKCPGSSDNFWNEIRFSYDSIGILSYYVGSYNTFDIEPYYCTTKARAFIERMEKKARKWINIRFIRALGSHY